MPERTLGGTMRLLLGLVGIAALVGGAVVAAMQIRSLARGVSPVPALLATVVATLVIAGGLHVVRGAVRGHIQVRRTGLRRSSGQRGE
jgi:hypothetical protein